MTDQGLSMGCAICAGVMWEAANYHAKSEHPYMAFIWRGASFAFASASLGFLGLSLVFLLR